MTVAVLAVVIAVRAVILARAIPAHAIVEAAVAINMKITEQFNLEKEKPEADWEKYIPGLPEMMCLLMIITMVSALIFLFCTLRCE
jgi:hypothetical protein